MRPALLAALAFAAAGCGEAATGILLSIDAPGFSVQSLNLQVSLDGGAAKNFPLPSPPKLPGTVLIALPDVAAQVTLTVTAELASGAPLTKTRTVASQPHQQVDVALVLGAPDDGGVVVDLAPQDLLAPSCDAFACVYAYRRRVTVTNDSASALAAGYTIRVPIDNTIITKLRADVADLRIFGATTERDRLFDAAPPGQSPALWFALEDALAPSSSVDYWLYYDYPNAQAAPADPTRVFPFYDDFSSTTLDPHWVATGAPLLSGSFLILRQAHDDGVRSDYATDGVDVNSAFEAAASITSLASAPTNPDGGNGPFQYWLGYQERDSFVTGEPWSVWIARGTMSDTIQPEDEDGTPGSACDNNCFPNSPSTQTTAERVYRIERAAAETRFFLDGALIYTAPAGATGDYSLMLRNFMATADLRVDWVRVRSLATPEPSVTVGAEQPVH